MPPLTGAVTRRGILAWPWSSDPPVSGTVRFGLLGPREWRKFRSLRVAAAASDPHAFLASPQEVSSLPKSYFLAELGTAMTIVAYRGREAVGSVSLSPGRGRGRTHDSWLGPLHVAAPHRRAGIGQALVQAALGMAPEPLTQVRCGILSGNHVSRRLFARCGFRPFGSQPDALVRDGVAQDRILLVRILDRPASGMFPVATGGSMLGSSAGVPDMTEADTLAQKKAARHLPMATMLEQLAREIPDHPVNVTTRSGQLVTGHIKSILRDGLLLDSAASTEWIPINSVSHIGVPKPN